MSKLAKQAGMGAVEVILILAVVALAGFIGWRVYDQNKSTDSDNTSQTNSDTPIEKAEDLDAEVNDLNSQDIDEQMNTSEINSTLE